MAELTFTAVVDDSHMLRLELPPEILGEVEVIVREKHPVGTSAALWQAVDTAPKVDDPDLWQRARVELLHSRDED